LIEGRTEAESFALATVGTTLDHWKARASALRTETYALYLACRDPRVPWPAKLLVAAIVAYVLSPIDLIPDFIPVLGYVDDLLIVPLGISLALKLIPRAIVDEHRARAAQVFAHSRPGSWLGAAFIAMVWSLALGALALAIPWLRSK
jgi:uncharacterized membrane protein YkvA (DUF1232 family)